MATTYTWGFPAFECYPTYESQTDVVFIIHWRVTADDGQGHSASVYGTQGVVYEAGTPFTPYADITPEQAEVWVQSAMGIDAVTALQQSLNSKIEALINPKSVTLPAPWAASITVTEPTV